MEPKESSVYASEISFKKNNAPPVAFEKVNNKNKNYKNHYPKNSLIIQISPILLDKLKRENYLDIIKFIIEHCDITLRDKSDYENETFIIKKKRINNTDNFWYKLSLPKAVKNKIKEEWEKNIMASHEEIKKINLEEEKVNEKDKLENKINNENIINDNTLKKGEIYYCKFHNKTFLNQHSYNSHCKSLHQFKCSKCGEVFRTILNVQNHFINCSKNNNEYNNININQNDDVKENTNEINISPKDNKINNINEEINSNIQKNIIINNNINEKPLENQEKIEINNDIKIEKDKHSYKNEKEENFYYFECYRDGKRFSSEKNYVKHFEKYHPNDFPFYCDQCHKGFFSSYSIENHIKSKKHKY